MLYRWQGNRQKAAKEFRDAYSRLHRQLEGAPSDEVLSAGIHVLYAFGDSLIDAPEQPSQTTDIAVPGEAVRSLREAVILSVRLFANSHPHGVSHAAEFFELHPTSMSTRALRNDLIAAYLLAPKYELACGARMTAETCKRPRNVRDKCWYRDNAFCTTMSKVSNRLSPTYRSQLESYIAGNTPEGTMWAVQSVAELEAENELKDDPEVSYNVANLLLSIKQPELAYSYLKPVTTGGDQSKITDPIERLTFVTSILSAAEPAAMAEDEKSDVPESEYRIEYRKLYPKEPVFRALHVADPQKTRRLDAWLFIRRYKYLLQHGEFETFISEHRRLMAMDVPKDFLVSWKQAVVGTFLHRVHAMRIGAQPDSARLIDEFISRSDLFSAEELKAVGLRRLFWTRKRVAELRILLAFLLLGVIIFGVRWLCAAYKWTFLSAYRYDREHSPDMQEDHP